MSDDIRVTQRWSAELLREVDVVAAGELMGNSKFSMIVKLLILPLGYVVIVMYLSSSKPLLESFLFGLPLGAGLMGLYSGYISKRVQAKFTQATLTPPHRSEPSVVLLSNEGVLVSNSHFEEHLKWTAVTAVVESDLALHIMLGATASSPVPYDGLPDGMTRDELRRRVEIWWKGAGRST